MTYLKLVTLAAALVTLLVVNAPPPVGGHGMLVVPINRGSMWREGWPTPPNWNDNEQFCGGFAVQWGENDGKCGECGDNWALPRPRPAENTGTYGTGQVVATYKQGEVITVVADITANHLGGFEFRLCPLESKTQLETQECFDKHPLEIVPDGGTYRPINDETGLHTTHLKLPDDVTCDLCVLQWTYICGNGWGVCANGTGTLGCGPQEHFRTCSDIAILPK